MPEHQPSYYLTDEAAERRIEKLIERIARDGLRPGESVPARIRVMADFRRGELRASVRRRIHDIHDERERAA